MAARVDPGAEIEGEQYLNRYKKGPRTLVGRLAVASRCSNQTKLSEAARIDPLASHPLRSALLLRPTVLTIKNSHVECAPKE